MTQPTDAPDYWRWLWLAYDAGRADALGEALLTMSDDDAAVIELVRRDWRLRMERTPAPPAPAWLAALQEAHAPEPWGGP